jgi:hypothetical protein
VFPCKIHMPAGGIVTIRSAICSVVTSSSMGRLMVCAVVESPVDSP